MAFRYTIFKGLLSDRLGDAQTRAPFGLIFLMFIRFL